MRADALNFLALVDIEQSHASVPVPNAQQDFAAQRDVHRLRMGERIGRHVKFLNALRHGLEVKCVYVIRLAIVEIVSHAPRTNESAARNRARSIDGIDARGVD